MLIVKSLASQTSRVHKSEINATTVQSIINWNRKIPITAHLQPQVQLFEWASYFIEEHVHTLTLLETHQNVGRAFGCFGRDVRHVVLFWQFLQDVIQDCLHLKQQWLKSLYKAKPQPMICTLSAAQKQTFSSVVCEAPSPMLESLYCSSKRVWKRLSDITVRNSISAFGWSP